MANSTDNFEGRAKHLLRLLQLCGGCVPLHRLQFKFSDSVIQTLLDKEQIGFDVQWGVLSAAQVGAIHKRSRVWIIATNSQSSRWGTSWYQYDKEPTEV